MNESDASAEELRQEAWRLIRLANYKDDENGICRCEGLEHRRECVDWCIPY